MNDVLKQYISSPEDLSVAISYISGFFNACFSTGSFLGPFIFTFIYKYLQWRNSTDIFSVLTLTYAVVLLLLTIKLSKRNETERIAKLLLPIQNQSENLIETQL
jgi:MFS family permease